VHINKVIGLKRNASNTLSSTHSFIRWNQCGTYTLEMKPTYGGGTYNDFTQ